MFEKSSCDVSLSNRDVVVADSFRIEWRDVRSRYGCDYRCVCNSPTASEGVMLMFSRSAFLRSVSNHRSTGIQASVSESNMVLLCHV
jgi:hypothetical protein